MLTSARRTPSQPRARARVEALLAATARLLADRGYEGLTTNHVAEAAGVPIGSVYQYFPNKDALLAALLDRHTDEMTRLLDDKLAELEDAPLDVAVRAYVQAAFAAHAKDPELLGVLYAQAPRMRGQARDLQAEARERIVAFLDARADEVRPADTRLAALLLVSSVEAIAFAAVRERPQDLEGEALTDEVVKLVLGYLEPTREPRGEGRDDTRTT